MFNLNWDNDAEREFGLDTVTMLVEAALKERLMVLPAMDMAGKFITVIAIVAGETDDAMEIAPIAVLTPTPVMEHYGITMRQPFTADDAR